MKLSKINSLIGYKKSTLPVLQTGVVTESGLVFSDFDCTVILQMPDLVLNARYSIVPSIGLVLLDDLVEEPFIDYANAVGDVIYHTSLDKEFSNAFTLCSLFVGKDDLRPIMDGVHLNKNVMSATNAHRAIEHTVNDKYNFPDAIINGKYAPIFEGATDMYLSETHTVVKTVVEDMQATFLVRNVDGKFPNLRAILESTEHSNKGVEYSVSDYKKAFLLEKNFLDTKDYEYFETHKSYPVFIIKEDGAIVSETGTTSIPTTEAKYAPGNTTCIIMPVMHEGGVAFNPSIIMGIFKGCDRVSMYKATQENKAIKFVLHHKESAKTTESNKRNKATSKMLAKEYFITQGFINDLSADAAHYVNILLK